MKKKYIILSALALLLIVCVIWVIWGNVTVGLTEVTLTETNLPAGFEGYRIAHVSDLHNTRLWEKAIARLVQAEPDIICITGDLVDCRRTDVGIALAFAAEAVKIAPCYYITGNHEVRLSQQLQSELYDGLTEMGVKVLFDEELLLYRNGESIALVGHAWGETENIGYLSNFEGYKILLSHQPETFENYVAGGYDLVLSGHAHGGQFRLPLVGGLYTPGEGLFPQYDSGLYSEGNTDMIVSRGIGNSAFPIRFHNRPEVLLIILEG